MQGIILAAGKSTRTYPLTATRPKPLLKIANKTILEYNLDALNGLVNEVIIVVGYRKEMIISFVEKIKQNYDFRIKFFEQEKQLGTGHAILILEKEIKDRFLVIMGDNLYSGKDILKCKEKKHSILVKEVNNPENFGVVEKKNDILVDLIEKPQIFVSNLINCAAYSLDKKIFSKLKEVKISKRGEYEITDAIKYLMLEEDIFCVKSKEWFPIGYPWDLLEADRHFRKGENNIGKDSVIKGDVTDSSIGNNCVIEGTVKDCVIFDNVNIAKDSIIESSVIGENVNFSGDALSEQNIKSIIKKKPVTVSLMGTVIADNVNAEKVSIKAGCKIWPNKNICGEIKEDVI